MLFCLQFAVGWTADSYQSLLRLYDMFVYVFFHVFLLDVICSKFFCAAIDCVVEATPRCVYVFFLVLSMAVSCCCCFACPHRFSTSLALGWHKKAMFADKGVWEPFFYKRQHPLSLSRFAQLSGRKNNATICARKQTQDALAEFALASLRLFPAAIRRQYTPKHFLLMWQCL